MRMKPNEPNENSVLLFEIANSWLSTKDVSRLLSVSPNAVRIMVCRGLIPSYRFNGRLRFRKQDCAALVKKTGAL